MFNWTKRPMKIIPYLRFAWATFMVINFFDRTHFQFGSADSTEVFFTILDGLITIVFSGYCITTGLQEIKRRQIFDAKYIEDFGLFFEFLIFIGGVYLFTLLLLSQPTDIWRLGLLIIWQFGLLILIIVDLKRIRTSENNRQHKL